MTYQFKLPSLTGKTTEEKLQQFQSYIYTLVGDLNYFASQQGGAKGESAQQQSQLNNVNLETIQTRIERLQALVSELKKQVNNLPDNGGYTFFSVSVDENGNLYAYTADDDDTTPAIEYDAETGNLYFITEGD